MGPGTAQPAPRGRGRCRSRRALRQGRRWPSRARLGCAQGEKAVKLGPTQAGGSREPTGAGEGPRRPQSRPRFPPRPLLPEQSGSKAPALPCRGRLLWDGNVKEPLSRRVTDQRRVKPKVPARGQKVVPSSLSAEGTALSCGGGTPQLASDEGALELHASEGDVPGQALLIFAPWVFSLASPVAKGKSGKVVPLSCQKS